MCKTHLIDVSVRLKVKSVSFLGSPSEFAGADALKFKKLREFVSQWEKFSKILVLKVVLLFALNT